MAIVNYHSHTQKAASAYLLFDADAHKTRSELLKEKNTHNITIGYAMEIE